MWFFFFNDTATTEIYTLSLHDALPISIRRASHFSEGIRAAVEQAAACRAWAGGRASTPAARRGGVDPRRRRSEEHTSELQSRQYLVCRLLLEKKKKHLSTLDICN